MLFRQIEPAAELRWWEQVRMNVSLNVRRLDNKSSCSGWQQSWKEKCCSHDDSITAGGVGFSGQFAQSREARWLLQKRWKLFLLLSKSVVSSAKAPTQVGVLHYWASGTNIKQIHKRLPLRENEQKWKFDQASCVMGYLNASYSSTLSIIKVSLHVPRM